MKIELFNVSGIVKSKIPFMVWIVVVSTFFATAIEFSFWGRTIAGWAWTVPFISSIYIILHRRSRITFPIRIWLPWISIVGIYFIIFGFSYLQRNIMLLCPIMVGVAVSAGRIRDYNLKGFLELIRIFTILFVITIVIKTGLLITGTLPVASALAAQGMTAALLCCIFAVGYSINRQTDLYRWIMGAIIPVIALTRMAIIATGLTMPLTFTPMKLKKRLMFVAIIGIVSIPLFYTERIQTKMFYSGSGTVQDIRLSNPDFATGGRSRLWDLMIKEIKEKPIWGHGPNVSEEFVFLVTWGMLTHPHNDWLRLLYDYGVLGTSIFAFCLVAQVIHLLKRAKRTFGESRVLLYAGASSFLPFILLMFTDNIILYAAFFGNLQFTILGLVYAAQKTQEIDAWRYFQVSSQNAPPNFPHPYKNVFNQRSFDL